MPIAIYVDSLGLEPAASRWVFTQAVRRFQAFATAPCPLPGGLTGGILMAYWWHGTATRVSARRAARPAHDLSPPVVPTSAHAGAGGAGGAGGRTVPGVDRGPVRAEGVARVGPGRPAGPHSPVRARLARRQRRPGGQGVQGVHGYHLLPSARKE